MTHLKTIGTHNILSFLENIYETIDKKVRKEKLAFYIARSEVFDKISPKELYEKLN